jgi:hypothetical protein
MAFKVNYNQQRAERDRAKQAKKEAKLREREEEANRRKMERDNPGLAAAPSEDEPNPEVTGDGTP